MKKITKAEAWNIIHAEEQRIFSVSFIKKDGTRREMVCRRGVTKYVKGVGMSYDPALYDLVTVFDMQKNEYRSIPVNRLLSLKLNGEVYEIEEAAKDGTTTPT